MTQPLAAGATAYNLDVVVDWTLNADDANLTSYRIYRGLDADSLEFIDEAPANNTSYTDRDAMLEPRGTWYAVEAVYADGATLTSEPTQVDTVHIEP